MRKNIDLMIAFLSALYFFVVDELSLLRFKYIFLLFAAILVFYHFAKIKLKENKKFYLLLKSLAVIFIILFFAVEAMMVFYPKHSEKDCDYVVVLGALVDKNEISQSLKARLDACIEYKNSTDDDFYIVVSGGQGRGENVTEASAMKEYLISNGVDKELILTEDKSKTTRENFIFSKEIIKEHSKCDFESLNIKIITTDFHALRSKLISYRCGYINTDFYTAKSNYKLSILNYTREFFALLTNIVLNY